MPLPLDLSESSPPSIPISPATLVPSDILDRFERRLAAVEAQNAALLRSLHLSQSPSFNVASDLPQSSIPSVTSSNTLKISSLDYEVPRTPSSPSQNFTASDRRCAALSARVQSLQDQLNKCVDACSSALDLERSMRAEVEHDNMRLAEENRTLKQEKETLERELKWMKHSNKPRLSFRDPPEEVTQKADDDAMSSTIGRQVVGSPLPSKTKKSAALRISTCSNFTDATLIDSPEPSPSLNRQSKRISWFLSAFKTPSSASIDFSNSSEVLLRKHFTSSQTRASEPSLLAQSDSLSAAEDHVDNTIAKRSSVVMQKAVKRASALVLDVVNAYGHPMADTIIEGVVL